MRLPKKIILFIFFNITVVVMFYSDSSNCLAQELNPDMGRLKIEGQYIERLVLRRKDGRTEQFENPSEMIKLPVGEYILEVRLKGGYSIIRNPGALSYNRVTISEDEPAVLKVGAPLKQTVKIERQGPVLVLNYELKGVGGETYSITRNKQPSFTIFKGGKKITSGQFEFG